VLTNIWNSSSVNTLHLNGRDFFILAGTLLLTKKSTVLSKQQPILPSSFLMYFSNLSVLENSKFAYVSSTTKFLSVNSFILSTPVLGMKGFLVTLVITPNFLNEDTPNYNATDIHNTFLPETSFTLKADKVDSSHCNNNAIGAFSQYVADEEVKLVGVEAAGHGLDTDKHAATMTKGSIGIVDGMKTYAVFKEDGELAPVYSISAGLDYPGVGPEHAYFKDSGRVEYVAATDEEAVQALLLLSKTEGIIPAIESSHAIAEAVKRAPKLSKDDIIIINVSGRGDKDVAAIADYLEDKK